MADPARPAFGPAHKVLVDGLTFCATTIIADDNFPLAVDLVAEAAAAAAPVGNPAIDGLAVAGRDLAAAWAARGEPGWSLRWWDASGRATDAVNRFAWARLCQSAEALRPGPNPEGAADA